MSNATFSTSAFLSALIFLSEILAVHGAGHHVVDEARQEDAPMMHEHDLDASSSPSLHFAAIGDWGAPLTSSTQRSGQRAVADGVASWLERVSDGKNNGGEEGEEEGASAATAPFILSLGDNFYPNGVRDRADMAERFDKSFDEVYDHDAFDDVKWYITAGNKDYENDADPTAQMDFPDSRWVFPDYFHRVVREVQSPSDEDDVGTMRVEVLLIDTMQLSGAIHYPAHANRGRAKETSQHTADRGLRWLDRHLRQSDADYLLVSGHFPYKSVPGLEALLKTHRVSAYVHGHEHCQRHKKKHHEVHQFVSGAGMELDCGGKRDTIDHKDGTGGFLSFHARPDKMLVRFHDQSGNELHHVKILPRSKLNQSRPDEVIEVA